MDLKELLLDKDFSFNRISSLIVIIVTSSLALMEIVIPFLKPYFENSIVHILTFVIVELVIVSFWYYKRSVFPLGNRKRQNLVIAITTEDVKQKVRIANDFAKELKRQLKNHGLNNTYEVVVLHNHLSETARHKIEMWIEARKANLMDSNESKSFLKMAKRLNAKFFVYGDLIIRNSSKSTYCLSIDALIMHAQTNVTNSKSLQREFAELWKREITFLEEDELNGFRSNAEQIFFTATYMMGLATLVDNKFEQGISIWNTLIKYIEQKPELAEYRLKVLQQKWVCCFLLSRLSYFRGDIELSLEYQEMYLEITPNEYDRHLSEAIRQVKLRGDAKLALEYVEKAAGMAGADGTWRYSKLYLLIKLGRMKEALIVFDEISQERYPNEIDSIYQVIKYNEVCYQEDENHIQSFFIIGCIMYKKLDRPLEAYERLEEFVSRASNNVSMDELRLRGEQYLGEINKVIGIK
ncbi:hypothetical protein RT717_21760 [Imperialibacter roseus]|uniref:Tetratricopeptide repeat protein n=1 Tax=Imperialibacter roseus TaxID=1324217 RepID=A0ABZ0IPQ5_9BACT|nr:hypothetical protein [Imperialibacter roseus]WOK05706.1 hypothetical protein RT717_21760 [Imperialibacter roseus]